MARVACAAMWGRGCREWGVVVSSGECGSGVKESCLCSLVTGLCVVVCGEGIVVDGVLYAVVE